MRITVEISLYPLRDEFVADIREFILGIRAHPRLEVVTNQLSTQIRGEFDDVMTALRHGMKAAMERRGTKVFVAKFLNADLPIGTTPAIEPEPG
jgi:uncharacterized protein YqgV (UPF0045/DUF77 family)